MSFEGEWKKQLRIQKFAWRWVEKNYPGHSFDHYVHGENGEFAVITIPKEQVFLIASVIFKKIIQGRKESKNRRAKK